MRTLVLILATMQWWDLHQFWFGEVEFSKRYIDNRIKLWFTKDENNDREIQLKFVPLLENLKQQELKSWKKSSTGWLSLIILYDQIPRNAFRGNSKSFEYDPTALQLCKDELGSIDLELNIFERLFFYLPLEHSENIEDQNLSLKQFRKLHSEQKDSTLKKFSKNLLDYAEAHHRVIDRFGRFPHRNEILGRESTEEELEFLKQPGSSF